MSLPCAFHRGEDIPGRHDFFHGECACKGIKTLLRISASLPEIRTGRQIMVGDHGRFDDGHLIVDVFDADAVSGGVRDHVVEDQVAEGMQIVLPQKLQCFLHRGGVVEQKTDGSGDGQVDLAGVLVQGHSVGKLIDGNAESFFVYAVERSVMCREQKLIVRHGAAGLDDEIRIDAADGSIAVVRICGENQNSAVLPVEIPSEKVPAAAFRLHGAASRSVNGKTQVGGIVRPFREERKNLFLIGGSAVFEKLLEPTVADIYGRRYVFRNFCKVVFQHDLSPSL